MLREIGHGAVRLPGGIADFQRAIGRIDEVDPAGQKHGTKLRTLKKFGTAPQFLGPNRLDERELRPKLPR
jgi:hypothetical protein